MDLWVSLAVVGALVAALGVQTYRVTSAHAALDHLRTTVAEEHAVNEAAARRATEQFRAQELRVDTTQRKVIDDTVQLQARDRAAAGAAGAAGTGLHARATAFALGGAPAQGAPAAPGCEAALGRAQVLADLLGGVVEEAVGYAATADQRGTAGQACERAYDALIPSVSQNDPQAGKASGQ